MQRKLRKRWTTEEDAKLKKWIGQGMNYTSIAKMLDRTPKAIEMRDYVLGISPLKRPKKLEIVQEKQLPVATQNEEQEQRISSSFTDAMAGLYKLFNYNGYELRTVVIDDVPWFVAKDVCDILELKDTSKACVSLDDDEVRTNSIRTNKGYREVLIISQSGLWGLIGSSRKKEATPFQRWIRKDVLPSIMKTGSYSVKESKDAMAVPASFAEALRLAADKAEAAEKERLLRLEAEKQSQVLLTDNLKKEEELAEASPKADFYDKHFTSDSGSIKMDRFAFEADFRDMKNRQLGRNQVYKVLVSMKILKPKRFPQDPYTPYAQYDHFFEAYQPQLWLENGYPPVLLVRNQFRAQLEYLIRQYIKDDGWKNKQQRLDIS